MTGVLTRISDRLDWIVSRGIVQLIANLMTKNTLIKVRKLPYE